MKSILCSLLVATLPFGSVLADAPKEKNAVGYWGPVENIAASTSNAGQ
jgi:hypothetical protein